RAALRDPGRDPDVAHSRRGPGRDVDRARDDRRPGRRRAGAGDLPGHQRRGRHHRRPGRSRRRARRRTGRGPADGRAAARTGGAAVNRGGLDAAADAWIAADPDPDDRAELSALPDRHTDPAAAAELADRFAGPLAFGTAGLRGPLRAGPAGMNTATVLRATAGLAAFLRARGQGE